MENDSVGDKGHADDIFGTNIYEAASPQKKVFLPWHKPRKQFVRDLQWCEQIQKLLDDFPRNINILKYFGLPGIDLIDLRFIHSSICEQRQIQLSFLGFNSGADPMSDEQVEFNISLDEVRKLSWVDPRSDIICDDFCRVANDDSIAWERTHAFGPYDVINLDLCDGFAKHAPGILEDTHYNALARLLSLQSRYKNPWLLLLTTRAGEGQVHPESLEKMLRKYLQNLTDCVRFKAESTAILEIADEYSLMAAAGMRDKQLPVFLVSLCKWFLDLAMNQQPPSKVEVKSVAGYRVNERAEFEDLISLAIRFEPTFVPADDSIGLANQTAQLPNECDMAVKALRRVSKRKDVDKMLHDDSELNNKMIDAMATLLELARYDVRAYREWLNEF